MGRLSGKVVVVTGASGGVGRAVVRELGAREARVAPFARSSASLASVEVGAARSQGLVYVADYEQVRRAAESIEADLGPIDIRMNVAFSSVFARFWDISPEEFERVTQVTYLGYVWGTRMLSRLGRHPRPVPPIYQPEVAARAMIFAAGLLDHYLARTGATAQLDKDQLPTEVANLWKPADESHPRSLQVWLSQHRTLTVLAVATVLAATYAAVKRGGSS